MKREPEVLSNDDETWDAKRDVQRLSKQIREAAGRLTEADARYLVDVYYQTQDSRIRAAAQMREIDSPNPVVEWLGSFFAILETRIKSALDEYTSKHEMGEWMRGVYGIGPVISAGLLSNIDIAKAPTVGHIWQFAGIAGDGQQPWKKGSKRPFNAQLKTLCWKAGQSFMKMSNRPDCVYGQLYRQQKAIYIERNLTGLFAERAAVRATQVSKSTEAYKSYSQGRLPPGHIDAMARRWAVKLFLAHLHGEWYQRHHGKPAPLPYPIAHLNHAHNIAAE